MFLPWDITYRAKRAVLIKGECAEVACAAGLVCYNICIFQAIVQSSLSIMVSVLILSNLLSLAVSRMFFPLSH